jgi:5-methylthioadenosine/S-adenosylhomocysteine deaminase
MDDGGDAPARLHEPWRAGIDASLDLHRRWHGQAGGRIRIALAPRFAVSCSRTLLEAVAAESAASGILVHTHASENRDEVAFVRAKTGLGNMAYLAQLGLASPRLCAAHCVWVDAGEQAIMAERGVQVLHCPGSNLKLGSGVAPIVALRAQGIGVSLGADGAACNNRLDMFDEMRLRRRSRRTARARLADRAGRAADGHARRRPGARPRRRDRLDRAGQAGRPHPGPGRRAAPRARAPIRGRRSSTRPAAPTWR